MECKKCLDVKNENDRGIIETTIYTLDSAKTSNPIPIGILFFKNTAKPGEEPKYKPNNYTFFATYKK